MFQPLWLFFEMGYSQKKSNREFEDMDFPGYQRNSIWNFQELIKNELEW